MRTVTEKFNVYTFEGASSELRDAIRREFDNDGYHYDHCMQERVKTLEALAELLNGRLDYSLSCVPDRGEYIIIKPKFYDFDSEELDFKALYKVINDDCPFTGVCYDHDFIDAFKESSDGSDIERLKYAFRKYIEAMHGEYEYMLSDEYLLEYCEANSYEFTENGKIYH